MTTSTKIQIIGLSGTNGSGKDTIGHLLARKYGYLFVSSTDLLAAELQNRNLPTDRIHKAQLSAEWRRESGMAAIIDKAVQQFNTGQYSGLVVGSLRHPGEVDRVHELGGIVIWVDADPKVRYARIIQNDRGRVEDKKSFDDWQADEHREMHPTGDAATLNVSQVKKQADIFIENNGSDIVQFEKDAEKALQHSLI